jgi:ubiquinone/menaquinone biosynthesis C-methylase UbiE
MKDIPNAVGLDRSAEMIQHAVGHRVIGDAGRQPFADESFDVALCSFTLSYLPIEALGELARIARTVIVSDLHPDMGWKRGFRVENESWEIEHNNHSLAQLDSAATGLRLKRLWRVEAYLGEPEREIFKTAGREWAFAEATQVPAIAITAWTRSSD